MAIPTLKTGPPAYGPGLDGSPSKSAGQARGVAAGDAIAKTLTMTAALELP